MMTCFFPFMKSGQKLGAPSSEAWIPLWQLHFSFACGSKAAAWHWIWSVDAFGKASVKFGKARGWIFAFHPQLEPYIHVILSHILLHVIYANILHRWLHIDRLCIQMKIVYTYVTDGRTDGRTDGQTDRQTDMQTCIHAYIHTYIIHTYIHTDRQT